QKAAGTHVSFTTSGTADDGRARRGYPATIDRPGANRAERIAGRPGTPRAARIVGLVTDLRPVDLAYPPAQRDDIVDDLHGRQVADPYRWLEDPSDPRTAEWSAAQDELASAWLDELPGRGAAAEQLRSLLSAGSVSAPVWRC